MPIWFALLVPILGAIVMYKWFRQHLAWWELVVPMASCILFILVFKFTIRKIQTSDTEYHGALLVKARYYEPYETWVKKTCSYTTTCCCDSKGNNCKTTTHYYDCSYCDENSPRYTATNSLGEEFSISKTFFEYLEKKWSAKRTFVELNRDINYHRGCGKDGDAYDIFWDNQPLTSESTTTEHLYENRVQAAHSAFDFPHVTPDDVKEYSLFKYPRVSGFVQTNVLGIDSIPWMRAGETEKFQQLAKYLNGKLGPEKHARIYWLIFKDKPHMAALLQEAYWDGGNDNELVICIGLSSTSRNMDWVKPFSWTPNREILVNIREDIMKLRRFDSDSVIEITHRNVLSSWKRKDFKEFNYLSVDIPGWAKLVTWIVTLLITVGLCWWAIANHYEADPKDPLKTITNFRY